MLTVLELAIYRHQLLVLQIIIRFSKSQDLSPEMNVCFHPMATTRARIFYGLLCFVLKSYDIRAIDGLCLKTSTGPLYYFRIQYILSTTFIKDVHTVFEHLTPHPLPPQSSTYFLFTFTSSKTLKTLSCRHPLQLTPDELKSSKFIIKITLWLCSNYS